VIAKSGGNLGTSLGVSTSGSTLIRTRGTGLVMFDAAATNNVVLFAIGLGIFSSDAFAVGAGSLPGPITDAGYSWVWHRLFSLGPALDGTQNVQNIGQNIPFEIDSKAMRKMHPNETMGFVAEGLVINGGGTVDFSVAVRQLFKLG